MKKKNLLLFIGIGLLAFLPFIRVSVAAPPCWVGVYEDDIYIWSYNNHTAARWGQWNTDAMGVTGLVALGKVISWFETMDDYVQTPGNMSHKILSLEDLGPDLEYGTNYPSVELAHELNYTVNGLYTYDWLDKLTGTTNVYNGLVLENSDEFALWHDNLTSFFAPENILETSMWVSTQINWDQVVATANTGLADVNAIATALADGFKITVAALAWTNNTLAVGLEVTYDDGLLDSWELTYGTETVFDIALEQGSSQFVECPPSAPGIPGYELPIIIGVASIMGLILIKKIKKK
ncbi:hypothetical protein LCGC14_0781000 [marine sediment metagenome]|uniref:Uncharacterized protein n=1 Tax=marine sediment metagenome TaxID=412755 RepID=A0A0F9QFB6_9ZZZZ